MVTYIYFVKCPNCEDEHFDFFDEAKDFAMGCLSKKPIITQIEVDRNDFGECVDSCDLGTVWSWEETMKDIPTESQSTVFSKSETFGCNCKNGGECTCGGNCKCGHDHEFEDEDFFAVNAEEDFPLDEGFGVSFNNKEDQREFFRLCRETGMYTPADLDRFMKEYEADDSNLLAKLRDYKAEIDSWDIEESCRKPIPEGMTIEQLVEEMEENEDTVECTLCQDLFDKSTCRKELNLGWLCSRCADDLAARGEGPVFKEDNYWDFLDESVDSKEVVEFEYDKLPVTLYGNRRSVDDWDEREDEVAYTYTRSRNDVKEVLWDFLVEDNAEVDVPGGLDTLATDDNAWEKFLAEHFDELLEKYHDKFLEYYEDDARRKFERDGNYSFYR